MPIPILQLTAILKKGCYEKKGTYFMVTSLFCHGFDRSNNENFVSSAYTMVVHIFTCTKTVSKQ